MSDMNKMKSLTINGTTYEVVDEYARTGVHSYNALYYGATGDGATDDSVALNALIQNLYSTGGGTIYLPAGIYMLDSSLIWKSNVSLVGAGVGLTILKPRKSDADAENFSAIQYSDSDNWNRNNPMINCHFCNFTIDGEEVVVGTYNPRAKGIFIMYMKDCSFEDLMIKNTGSTGLGIDFLQNVTINKVHCYNCGRAYEVKEEEAVLGAAGIGIATMAMEVESCIITNCIAENCGNYGIFVEGTNEWYLYTDDSGEMATNGNFTITNCQCINGRNYGIVVKGTHNVMVSNNICNNNARDGFAILTREGVYSKNVSFVNNQSINNGGHGFRIDDPTRKSTNIIISGNFIHKNLKAGFYMFGNTTVSNLTISDNVISKNGEHGIYINEMTGLTRDVAIIENHIHHNTSDGLLITSSISDSDIVNNIIRGNGNRGIALAEKTYTNLGIYGNTVYENIVRDWHINGTFIGTKTGHQAMQVLYPLELKWEPGLLDDAGELKDSDISFVTEDYFYCGGARWVCFDRSEALAGTGSRIVCASFYDGAQNHVSREYVSNTSSSIAKFNVP